MHVLDATRTQIHLQPNLTLTSHQEDRFFDLIAQRQDGVPVAYITREAYFWKQKLHITPKVLVPRPETELVVETALSLLQDGDRVLDLGTGSGAIAFALRSELDVDVVATDVDTDALDVCRTNASRLGLCVQIVESNWFSAIAGNFDVIVSNPPYVGAGDPRLLDSDIRHEPLVALASGSDGLDALRTVVAGAARHLVKDGWLIVEHGYDQRQEVVKMFEAAGFKDIQYLDDLARIPRVAFGKCCE